MIPAAIIMNNKKEIDKKKYRDLTWFDNMPRFS
jgi:hypothetical protein